MEKKKPKTAIGRFIDQLPGGPEQFLTRTQTEENSENTRTGESLIFELPSGKKVKFIAKLVAPRKCKIWKGNVRLQEFLNDESTNDLRDKIIAQGQLVPVLARPLKGDPTYSHEIIYGSRRHFVCSSLGREIKILEADLDDNDALAFMNAENSGREDLSPYEMALAYKFWIDNGIFKSQGELSEQLGITRSWLNKIISLAKIPKELIAALNGPKSLLLNHGLQLVKRLTEDSSSASKFIKNAITLRHQGLKAEDVIQQLLSTTSFEKAMIERGESKVINSIDGEPICRIKTPINGQTILAFNRKLPGQKLSILIKEIENIVKNFSMKDI